MTILDIEALVRGLSDKDLFALRKAAAEEAVNRKIDLPRGPRQAALLEG